MTRDCGHSTGDDQRLQTQYRRWSETTDIVQEMTADTLLEMTRDCRHITWDHNFYYSSSLSSMGQDQWSFR
ncbi:unnamed protein product, partial [Staurois parvus]